MFLLKAFENQGIHTSKPKSELSLSFELRERFLVELKGHCKYCFIATKNLYIPHNPAFEPDFFFIVWEQVPVDLPVVPAVKVLRATRCRESL